MIITCYFIHVFILKRLTFFVIFQSSATRYILALILNLPALNAKELLQHKVNRVYTF